MNQADDKIREKVIGAAMAVHRTLGPGFLESVYQRALAVELRRAGVAFEEQSPLEVRYKGEVVGDFLADFVVERSLIVEIKAVSTLLPAHDVQTVNYLNATGLGNGLLINFGAASLQFHRKFRNPKNPVNPVNPVPISAFTILELLVAMAVMALLLVVLMNMVDGATKLWRTSENRVDAYREARAALGIIARDLQNTVATTNTNYFLTTNAAFAPLAGLGTAVTNTNNAAALFFLTALPTKAQNTSEARSDVCQVGYFLALDTAQSGGARTLNLYRYFRSSDPTFDGLKGVTTMFRTPPPLPASRDTELLARNIVSFSTRAFTQTNNTLVTFTSSTNTPVPDLVELSISAINQDAARKLDATVSAWTNVESAVIKPSLQTFTTRIRLNRPPPN